MKKPVKNSEVLASQEREGRATGLSYRPADRLGLVLNLSEVEKQNTNISAETNILMGHFKKKKKKHHTMSALNRDYGTGTGVPFYAIFKITFWYSPESAVVRGNHSTG